MNDRLMVYLKEVSAGKVCPMCGRSVRAGTVFRHFGRCTDMTESEYGRMLLYLTEVLVRWKYDNLQTVNGDAE